MQNDEAVVVAVQNKVHILRCLRCGFNVFGAARCEADEITGRRENTHQRRHHHFDAVGYFGHNNLRATRLLVTELLAQIEIHRLDAVAGEFLVGEINCRLDFAADDGLECDVVFFAISLAILIFHRPAPASSCGRERPGPIWHSCASLRLRLDCLDRGI